MGKLVVTTKMTLDAVVQDPDGTEGFSLGGWFGRYGAADLAAWAQLETEEALASIAPRARRTSDEWFASRWLGRDGVWADKLNSMPKKGCLEHARQAQVDQRERPIWRHHATGREAQNRTPPATSSSTGDTCWSATLLEADLVDEFRLVIFPVILGSGEKLFAASSQVRPLKLHSSRTLGSGLAFLNYEVIR
jgi:hypothetical protein